MVFVVFDAYNTGNPSAMIQDLKVIYFLALTSSLMKHNNQLTNFADLQVNNSF